MKIFYCELETSGYPSYSGACYTVVSLGEVSPLLQDIEKELNEATGPRSPIVPMVTIRAFDTENASKADLVAFVKALRWSETYTILCDHPGGLSFCSTSFFWIARILDGTVSSVEEFADAHLRSYNPDDAICFERVVEERAWSDALSGLDGLDKPEEWILETMEQRVALAAGWLQVNPTPVITRGDKPNTVLVDWGEGKAGQSPNDSWYTGNDVADLFPSLAEQGS